MGGGLQSNAVSKQVVALPTEIWQNTLACRSHWRCAEYVAATVPTALLCAYTFLLAELHSFNTLTAFALCQKLKHMILEDSTGAIC